MADNIAVTAGSGTTIATDDVANVHYQRVKLDVGKDGATQEFGGLQIKKDIDLDEAAPENIKASAGYVFGWVLTNNAVAARFVKLYNKASAPVLAADTPAITIQLPASSQPTVGSFPNGIEFATGIGWAATTGVGDADVGAPGANDIVATLLYK